MKTFAGIGAVAVLVVVLVLARTCHTDRHPVEAVIGVDTSGSARPRLSEYVLHASRLISHLEPGCDTLTLFRVDAQTQEFYRDTVHGGREAALKRFLIEVARQPKRSCTLPELFWREVAERSAKAQHPVCIVYFSDGDNDDLRPESEAALHRLGEDLAANRRIVAVHLVGITTANRACWERCFAPLGDRLTLAGENEIEIDSVLERLEHCRTTAQCK